MTLLHSLSSKIQLRSIILIDIADVIARLTPETEEALKPLDFLHNRSFVLQSPSSPPREETSSPRTRETTPACSPKPGRAIVLTYSRLPYDGTQGFVFGSWDEKCDILLADKPSAGGISLISFRINFIFDSGCLTLIDMSSHGTRVNSTITLKTEDVRKSALPLASGDRIQVGVVILKLEIPTEDGWDELRRLKWEAYKEEYLAAVPKRNGVPQELSQPQTVMEEGRISLLHHRLGVGLRGKVRKAVDNKGNFYAVKIYRSAPDQRDSIEISTLGTLDHVSHPHIPGSELICSSLISSKYFRINGCDHPNMCSSWNMQSLEPLPPKVPSSQLHWLLQ